MDKMVGRLIAHVDQIGLAEETLIIFTADNGTDTTIVSRFRGQDYKGEKGSMLNAGTHVPLMVRWKGNAIPGKISQKDDSIQELMQDSLTYLIINHI